MGNGLVGLLRRHMPRDAHHPTSASAHGDALRVRWLGTAGHVVQTATTTVLLDPFLTRPGVFRTLTQRLAPTPDAWWHWLPDRVDAICTGHSHYDHLLDAPIIAQRTGAKLIGSASTASFARAQGLDEAQIIEVPKDGLVTEVGDIVVRFVPSLHGRVAAGRVPFPGEVTAPPTLPARVHHYRMGGAFGVHLSTPAASVYHNGSADLDDAELEGLDADMVLVGLAGRKATTRYLERLCGILSPKLVVPTHHDAFFAPLEAGVRLLPGIAFDGFVADIERVSPGVTVRAPTFEDTLHVPAGRPEDAVFTAL